MRKRVFRRLLALLLAACALRAFAFAETAKVTGSEVNVRSGPGTEYAIMGSYIRGSLVEVTSRQNPDWYEVSFQGQTGYMASQYLSIQTDAAYETIVSGGGASIAVPRQGGVSYSSPASVYGPTPTPTPTASPGAASGGALIISDWDTVGLIVAPSPLATETPTLVITTPSPVPSPSPTPIPTVAPSAAVLITPTPLPTASPSPTPSPSPVPSPTPTVAPSPTPTVAETKSGSIAGDYVRFRKGPGTEYSILNTYDRGKALTVLGQTGDWTYCEIDGQSGYVFSQYVCIESAAPSPSPSPSPTPAVSDTGSAQSGQLVLDQGSAPAVSGAGSEAYIRGNNVRFRSGPGLSYAIYTELFYGNIVTVTGTSGDWTAVVYKGQAGYVYSQYVAQGSAQTTSVGGTATGREIADYALSFLGTPYTWGGRSPAGFDCSGLVWYVYQHFGYTLNRVAAEQAKNGRHIEASELQPGDLICFYSGGSYIGHVGIYIGNNLFVHAASSTTGVITSELVGYYANRGFECRRII